MSKPRGFESLPFRRLRDHRLQNGHFGSGRERATPAAASSRAIVSSVTSPKHHTFDNAPGGVYASFAYLMTVENGQITKFEQVWTP